MLFPQVVNAAALYRRSPDGPLWKGYILLILDIYFLWMKTIADIIDINTFHFLYTGIWWLFNSQDVGSNR